MQHLIRCDAPPPDLNSANIHYAQFWGQTATELAICTARIEAPGWVEPRALLHALCHYALQTEIILADFNLVVSTQTSYQAIKFNSLSNFPAIRYVDWLKIW